jgi:hypothetical protein
MGWKYMSDGGDRTDMQGFGVRSLAKPLLGRPTELGENEDTRALRQDLKNWCSEVCCGVVCAMKRLYQYYYQYY